MEVTRRGLFTLVRPHHRDVPTIEASTCTSQWGCGLCLSSCHRKALLKEGGEIRLEDSLCDGCGCCSSACPWNAIRFPGFSVEETTSQLRDVLFRAPSGAEPRIIMMFCKGGEDRIKSAGIGSASGFPPETFVPFKLPCLAMPLSSIVIDALAAGADGVSLFPCDEKCRYGFGMERAMADVRFLHSVMSHVGLEPMRLQLVGKQPLLQLAKMKTDLRRHRALKGQPKCVPESFSFPSLAVTRLFSQTGSPPFSLEGDGVPCGLVEVKKDLCSLCGLCAKVCLSRALTLEKRDGRLHLLFRHGFCGACGECSRICPDGALSLRHALHSELLHELLPVADAPISRCSVCGKGMIPTPLMKKLSMTLSKHNPKLEETLSLCPACRSRRYLASIIAAT